MNCHSGWMETVSQANRDLQVNVALYEHNADCIVYNGMCYENVRLWISGKTHTGLDYRVSNFRANFLFVKIAVRKNTVKVYINVLIFNV